MCDRVGGNLGSILIRFCSLNRAGYRCGFDEISGCFLTGFWGFLGLLFMNGFSD